MMNDQTLQIGDHKSHLGIDYYFFGDEELDCPICGAELYRQVPYTDQLPKRKSCPHVIYYWEKTRLGGHFFFVRPDFAKAYIRALLKSDYYKEFLQNPHRNNPHTNRSSMHHPRRLKNNDIALFASGDFSSDDPMFVDSKASAYNHRFMEKIRDSTFLSSDGTFFVDSNVHFDETWFLERMRYEEIGAKVGNISFECPSIRHPELLAEDVVVHYNFEGVWIKERSDSRTRYIAISPTEYHNPGVRGLSEL